ERLNQLQSRFDRMLRKASRTHDQKDSTAQPDMEQLARRASSVPAPAGGSPPPLPVASEIEELPEGRLAAARRRLHELIGLQEVKSEVETLTNFLKVQSQRQQSGLPRTPVSLHLVFVGNPG